MVISAMKSIYMEHPHSHTQTHLVLQGISANEVINFFFDKETRLEWEGTLESVDLIETLTEDTMIFHQLHKRVWPSTQRETLFCSHLCTLPNAPHPENMVGHTWMVCNFSTDHDKVPVSPESLVLGGIGLVNYTSQYLHQYHEKCFILRLGLFVL